MKNKILKIVIAISSLVLIATISMTINQSRIDKVKEQVNPTEEIESTDFAVTETQPVMTQEELEETISSYKAGVEEVISTESIEEHWVVEGEEVILDQEAEEPAHLSSIDFTELQALNPDVYAWISVPGTEIEYPILQHATDNSYYLNYNIDGSYGYPGCIYTENMNAKDFTSNHTVIYGHNMKNGSMFAGLHNFSDQDFFDTYKQVLIYTPSQTFVYQIFAAYVYDDRHLLYSFDFEDSSIYQSYLDSVLATRDASANVDYNISVTSDNKIITLATCVANNATSRFLVQAVLIEVSSVTL